MSDANYGSFSIDELIKQFERSCLMQYETDITGDIDIFNHEYQTLVDITNELQVRGPLARRELVTVHIPPPFKLRRLRGLRAG